MISQLFVYVLLLVLFAPSQIIAQQQFVPLAIAEQFTHENVSPYIEFIEDPTNSLSFEEVRMRVDWQRPNADTFNFGFTENALWFRFTLENRSRMDVFLLEITYPMLDSVVLYRPNEMGEYERVETGDLLPFFHREVEYVSFVFYLHQKRGTTSQYFFKIKSSSSSNFSVNLYSSLGFYSKLAREQPVIWIFYGLMIIMVVYNFIIFTSSRDVSYLFYSVFISSWIVLQMCLNGYAFQYLWPQHTWWGNKSLPFFMAFTYATVGVFFIYFLELFKYPRLHFLVWIICIIPALALSAVTLIVPYSVAIRLTTFFAGVCAIVLYIGGIFVSIRYKSRQALFVNFAFMGFVLGIVLYVLKTFGILPTNFITQWSIQIGSALVVVLLSFGLADKINTMRKDLARLLKEQQESERNALEKAKFLEGVVGMVNEISEDFLRVSKELGEISAAFSQLSMEQASTSEQMSSTFDELVASIERIHHSTLQQQAEGEKSKRLADELNLAQQSVLRESMRVAKSVEEITKAAKTTEESLKLMTERMNIINAGGKEIDQFVTIIDDISDKINLLSLNAAIEAARAGEYGRGFAVVADEIGKLAQATSDNSKRIAHRIKKVIADIEQGTNLVINTKESTDVIFSMVETITTGISEVKRLMEAQNKILEIVVQQAAVIDLMSREVASATQEQKNAMLQTMHTIERLSEMSVEISSANHRIFGFIGAISRNSEKLANVVNGAV
ncbi:MAG: methyl-accepting chemotaxis protein [Spirochaetes bacterium]|nr:methyl-accepting chemotaxis protein [Spirochaetota bacterium]